MIWPGTSRTQRKVWKLQFLMAEDKRNNKLGLVFGGDALIAAVPTYHTRKTQLLKSFRTVRAKNAKSISSLQKSKRYTKNEVFH